MLPAEACGAGRMSTRRQARGGRPGGGAPGPAVNGWPIPRRGGMMRSRPPPARPHLSRPEETVVTVAAARSSGSAPGPEIRTAVGVLRGGREAGLAVFRGVRYAEPPVGALRFAAPRPVRGWAGVRAALSYGPPPPQPSAFGTDGPAREAVGDDWLSLNVWSPDPAAGAGLPVLVWIPGGGYVIGSSSLPEFDGGRLAANGVVVVTLNYRLGMEGFAQIDGAPANRGLLDQVAALHWVRENIRAFGGDPNRMTIFGESAGGGSVAALLAMPRSAGLWHRACRGRSSRRSLLRTSPPLSPPNWGCSRRRPTCPPWNLRSCPWPARPSPRRSTGGRTVGVRSPSGRCRSRQSLTAMSCPPPPGRRWPAEPPVTSTCW